MNGGVVCWPGDKSAFELQEKYAVYCHRSEGPAAPGTRVIWTACSGEQTYNWGPHGGAFQLTYIVDTYR